jgi:hypothetical protein
LGPAEKLIRNNCWYQIPVPCAFNYTLFRQTTNIAPLSSYILPFFFTTVRLNFTENPAMLDISRPPQADFCQQGVAFYSTIMVFAFANNLWDCPVRLFAQQIAVGREGEKNY